MMHAKSWNLCLDTAIGVVRGAAEEVRKIGLERALHAEQRAAPLEILALELEALRIGADGRMAGEPKPEPPAPASAAVVAAA